MPETHKIYDDEIDLIGYIESLWRNKWVIAFFIIISILILYVFNFINPNTSFLATTKIKPITSSEFDKYRLYNAHIRTLNYDKFDNINQNQQEKPSFDINGNNLFEITPNILLELFLEQIEEGSIFEKGIKKFNLVERDKYDNEKDYNDAIIKLASEIEIFTPDKENKTQLKFHLLSFKYNDFEKWMKVLQFIINEKNNVVKQIIHDRFRVTVNVAKQNKKFEIEDINTKAELEVLYYNSNIESKLAYLHEQAAIARKLNVKKTTIETQLFNSKNSVVTNVKIDDVPFYLRGYEAIEEEIRLIENRSSEKLFIPKLGELQIELETLRKNKSINRAVELFKDTPVYRNKFNAVLIKVASTTVKFNDRPILKIIITIIIGSILGSIYVLIGNAIRKRRNQMISS